MTDILLRWRRSARTVLNESRGATRGRAAGTLRGIEGPSGCCEHLDDPVEALDHWLWASEECFSAFIELPDPLMTAARSGIQRTLSRFSATFSLLSRSSSCAPRRAGGKRACPYEAVTCFSLLIPSTGLEATELRRSLYVVYSRSSRLVTASRERRRNPLTHWVT